MHKNFFYIFVVDIWSVGCILGEMITRKALFKGVDHILFLFTTCHWWPNLFYVVKISNLKEGDRQKVHY